LMAQQSTAVGREIAGMLPNLKATIEAAPEITHRAGQYNRTVLATPAPP
jgi:hypothetical protein